MNYSSVHINRAVDLEANTIISCNRYTASPKASKGYFWRQSSGLDGTNKSMYTLLSSELNYEPEQRSVANSPTDLLHLE